MFRTTFLRPRVFKVAALACGLHLCISHSISYNAAAKPREIASIPTSGFVFKDSLKLFALEDPKVDGVVIYLSDIELHAVDKVATFFSDPSSASITCAQVGPVKLHEDVNLSKDGEDIYGETRNLFFKVLLTLWYLHFIFHRVNSLFLLLLANSNSTYCRQGNQYTDLYCLYHQNGYQIRFQ